MSDEPGRSSSRVVTMKLAPVLTLLACVVLVGCATESSSDPGPAPINSGVQGVPIPESAVPEKSAFVSGDAWTVPDLSYDELRDWYEGEMPRGEDFKTWAWCDAGGLVGSNKDGDDGITLIYAKPPKRILAVALVKEDDPNPPAILIGVDNSGPC